MYELTINSLSSSLTFTSSPRATPGEEVKVKEEDSESCICDLFHLQTVTASETSHKCMIQHGQGGSIKLIVNLIDILVSRSSH